MLYAAAEISHHWLLNLLDCPLEACPNHGEGIWLLAGLPLPTPLDLCNNP